MFSNNLDINEAVKNIKELSHDFFVDTFSQGISELNSKTGLALEPNHIRKSKHYKPISEDHVKELKNILALEYQFLELIRK